MPARPVVPLTAERLRELIAYNPATGEFRWLKKSSPLSRVAAGSLAGSIKGGGYREIEIDGVAYQAHRLACLYVTGEWPDNEIDHRDLNRSNNAWRNLRPATTSQNHANKRPRGKGPKGVARQGNRFVARIRPPGGRNLHLGCFATQDEAAAAYRGAAKVVYGEFARTK